MEAWLAASSAADVVDSDLDVQVFELSQGGGHLRAVASVINGVQKKESELPSRPLRLQILSNTL